MRRKVLCASAWLLGANEKRPLPVIESPLMQLIVDWPLQFE
jgi:hypothetical protein